MSGLLIGGVEVPVPGVEIVNCKSGPPWCRLGPEDYRTRMEKWVRSIGLHSTKGKWPQKIVPGEGPDGMEEVVARYWRESAEGKKRQSAAQIVVGCQANEAACLGDLLRQMAHHAERANPFSFGIEMYQLADGTIFQATIDTTVRILATVCNLWRTRPELGLAIPFQIVGDRYAGKPLQRLVNGGPDVIGIWGHRDQTDDRGAGDPGDAIYSATMNAGAESFCYAAGGDLGAWGSRQRKLNAMGEKLNIDGLAGPGTMAALRRRGFIDGRALDMAVEAQ
jgi:hypothetical protein